MNPSVYAALCNRTECDQNNAIVRLSGAVAGEASNSVYLPIRLNHSVVGLAGEVGELASVLQKMVYYGKPLTTEVRKDLLEEYGDVLWFVAEGLNALGADMGEVMEANIRKLKARYPERYSDYQCAQENRDRKAEAAALVARYDDEEAHTPVTRREVRQRELELGKREEDRANAERDALRKRYEAERSKAMISDTVNTVGESVLAHGDPRELRARIGEQREKLEVERARLQAEKARLEAEQRGLKEEWEKRVHQDGHGFGHAGLCEGD